MESHSSQVFISLNCQCVPDNNKKYYYSKLLSCWTRSLSYKLEKKTVFQKVDLFPSSGEWEKKLLGSLEGAILSPVMTRDTAQERSYSECFTPSTEHQNLFVIIIIIIKLSRYSGSAIGKMIEISEFSSWQGQKFYSSPLSPHQIEGPAHGIFTGNWRFYSGK